MKQSDIIKQLSDRELTQQLILSQLLIATTAFILSFFLFGSLSDWFHYFKWDTHDFFVYGFIPATVIVAFDLIIIRVFPKKHYDDGGINERIFKNRSVLYIGTISLFVAVAEELLFRGAIQTTFGYFIASLVFALIHIRYLRKPVLLASVLLTSFFIGYLFEITENLNVTITTHFFVDFLLGLFIRFKK